MMSKIGIAPFLCVTFLCCVNGASLNDTKTLLRDLISNYNKNVRPVHNKSEIVNVTVQLSTKEVEVDTTFSENPMWELFDTKAKSEPLGHYSQVSFSFKLRRRPAYVFVNVVLPIMFLSVLNLLVFLLVPESGERVAYCITVLLSIAVIMTIVSAMLPRTSKPVPIVSYKLIVDMVISAAITVVVIFNLRTYSRDPEIPVPKWLIVDFAINEWIDEYASNDFRSSRSLYGAHGARGAEIQACSRHTLQTHTHHTILFPLLESV
ncbi:neuronal acetylcholine receptor subunit alpha-6-like [Dreissena polymorpha]|uniref:neuronal acetylcholine receptor subunit alpha-6-like n=1 Tax=Dreissena polymorpha TaxID=45954 RepID=UPI002263DEDC|nr:neuronal acetylcholine receptor subunit alpha-6-like [Dreissena polymorpha]